MQQDESFNVSETLTFWQDMACRLRLTRIHDEENTVGPATVDDIDDHLEELRHRSEHLLNEGTPYVPALIRLFIESDADLVALLEAYGRNRLQQPEKDAVIVLMKAMPGLWAAATEIQMINNRDRLFHPDDKPAEITAEVMIEAEKKKKKKADLHGPWTTSDRPTGSWPDFHSLTIW